MVVVLWVLAILTILALSFGRRAMLDRQVATYSLEHAQAMYMARGAVMKATAELRNKAVMDLSNKQEGRTSYCQAWAKPVDLLSDATTFGEETNNEDAPEAFGEGAEEATKDICTYLIEDEGGKISLAAADLDILSEVPGLKRAVRKIKVRREGDSDADQKPQPFQTIEELRFMSGIDDEDWFGEDDKPGLKDLLTCFNDGAINVNTAPQEVLECIPELEGVVDSIVSYRNGPDGDLRTEDDQDFKSLDEFKEKMGIGKSVDELKKHCKTDSGSFTIVGIATKRHGKIRATCVATVGVGGGKAGIAKWREEFIDAKVQ